MPPIPTAVPALLVLVAFLAPCRAEEPAVVQAPSPRWRYEPGQILRYELTVQTVTGKAEGTLDSIKSYTIEEQVKEVRADGSAVLAVRFLRVRVEDDIEMLDSQTCQLDARVLAETPTMALVGRDITVVTSALGSIDAVEGLDALADEITPQLESAMQAEIEEKAGGDEQKAAFVRNMSSLFVKAAQEGVRRELSPKGVGRLLPQWSLCFPESLGAPAGADGQPLTRWTDRRAVQGLETVSHETIWSLAAETPGPLMTFMAETKIKRRKPRGKASPGKEITCTAQANWDPVRGRLLELRRELREGALFGPTITRTTWRLLLE